MHRRRATASADTLPPMRRRACRQCRPQASSLTRPSGAGAVDRRMHYLRHFCATALPSPAPRLRHAAQPDRRVPRSRVSTWHAPGPRPRLRRHGGSARGGVRGERSAQRWHGGGARQSGAAAVHLCGMPVVSPTSLSRRTSRRVACRCITPRAICAPRDAAASRGRQMPRLRTANISRRSIAVISRCNHDLSRAEVSAPEQR